MTRKHLIITAMLALACMTAQAQTSFGDAVKFDDGWLFSLTDDPTQKDNSFDDKDWRKLDLPHDWSVEGQLSPTLASCTGYLPGGIGWYRKHFTVSDNAPRHYIYFEGVYNRSEVYLNGQLLGKRPNGYVSFMYDLTPYLKEGESVLAVRVDHSRYAGTPAPESTATCGSCPPLRPTSPSGASAGTPSPSPTGRPWWLWMSRCRSTSR